MSPGREAEIRDTFGDPRHDNSHGADAIRDLLAALDDARAERDRLREERDLARQAYLEHTHKPPLRWTTEPPTSPVPMVLVRKIKGTEPGRVCFGKVYQHPERGLWFYDEWTQSVKWLADDGAEWCVLPAIAEMAEVTP